ncbi:hypothetical protein [Rhizobium sp. CF142]|uniref:hypothetical protein n=1 Tax=Rhizobium sp. CF142 TaxID=1144314 RepID=UPI00138AB8F7|nr:hypothetical protein [Rhizobium sp. CF142]
MTQSKEVFSVRPANDLSKKSGKDGVKVTFFSSSKDLLATPVSDAQVLKPERTRGISEDGTIGAANIRICPK